MYVNPCDLKAVTVSSYFLLLLSTSVWNTLFFKNSYIFSQVLPSILGQLFVSSQPENYTVLLMACCTTGYAGFKQH